MTEEVGRLVLRNNYLQSLAVSTLQARAAERIAELGHVIHALERGGTLDRALEALPVGRRDRRAAPQGPRAHAPGTRDAAVVLEDLALGPARRHGHRRRPVPGRRADALFPGAGAAALPARDPSPPAAPRDHRHGDHQQPREPHGAGVRDPHAGRHGRRRRQHRARLLDRARDHRHARPVGRHRGARRPRADGAAVRHDVRDDAPPAPSQLLGAAEPGTRPRHRAGRFAAAAGHPRADARPARADRGHRGRALRALARPLLARRRAAAGCRAASRVSARSTPASTSSRSRCRAGRRSATRPASISASAPRSGSTGSATRSSGSWSRATGRRWRAARCARNSMCCSAGSASACSRARAAATHRSAWPPGSSPAATRSGTSAGRCARCARPAAPTFPTLSVALEAVRRLVER